MPRPKRKSRTPPKPIDRDVAARWSPILAKAGWTPISLVFLEGYRKLDPPISNPEALFVIHLMAFKWDAGKPYPGFKTLAGRMGITATSARNQARSLEEKGYLIRDKRVGTTNRFDLTPLFAALESYLERKTAEKLKRRPNRDPSTEDALRDLFG